MEIFLKITELDRIPPGRSYNSMWP
jgi:hypothetical protein